jgi:hypothetical protein
VLSLPKSELLKIRNFGQKSLDELYDKLAERELLPEVDTSDDAEAEGETEGEGEEPKAEAEAAVEATDDVGAESSEA